MFRPVAAQVLVFQEEVDAQIRIADNSGVLYGKVADAGKNEVLECLDADDARARVEKENVRLFERDLARSSPQPQLAVVPALVSSCGRCVYGMTYFLSLAVGPWTGGGRSAIAQENAIVGVKRLLRVLIEREWLDCTSDMTSIAAILPPPSQVPRAASQSRQAHRGVAVVGHFMSIRARLLHASSVALIPSLEILNNTISADFG